MSLTRVKMWHVVLGVDGLRCDLYPPSVGTVCHWILCAKTGKIQLGFYPLWCVSVRARAHARWATTNNRTRAEMGQGIESCIRSSSDRCADRRESLVVVSVCLCVCVMFITAFLSLCIYLRHVLLFAHPSICMSTWVHAWCMNNACADLLRKCGWIHCC